MYGHLVLRALKLALSQRDETFDDVWQQAADWLAEDLPGLYDQGLLHYDISNYLDEHGKLRVPVISGATTFDENALRRTPGYGLTLHFVDGAEVQIMVHPAKHPYGFENA